MISTNSKKFFQNAGHETELVSKMLGVSRSSGYELMHGSEFPVLKVGRRMVVPKWELITAERSCRFNEAGMKRNGNNVCTILSTKAVAENYHQRQLHWLGWMLNAGAVWNVKRNTTTAKKLKATIVPMIPNLYVGRTIYPLYNNPVAAVFYPSADTGPRIDNIYSPIATSNPAKAALSSTLQPFHAGGLYHPSLYKSPGRYSLVHHP